MTKHDNENRNISPCNSQGYIRLYTHKIYYLIDTKKMQTTPLNLLYTTSYCILSSFWVLTLTNPILSYEESSRYWSRGHLIYHTAWNPEKIFDHGGYSIPFSPSTHIYPVFFPPAKSEWWQLSRRWDLWQKLSLSLHRPLRQLHLQHSYSRVAIDA